MEFILITAILISIFIITISWSIFIDYLVGKYIMSDTVFNVINVSSGILYLSICMMAAYGMSCISR